MFQIKIGAIILLSVVMACAFQCAVFTDDPAICMRLNLINFGLWLLHFSALATAMWLGIEAARASKKTWLGWVTGLIILVVLNVGLSWMGFTLPEYEIDDGSDNSYRR